MTRVQNKAKQYKQQDDMKLREYETKPNNIQKWTICNVDSMKRSQTI